MWLPSSSANDPLHQTYYASKRDAQAEYLNPIITALRNIIHNVNFVDPTQIRKAHEVLMSDDNKEVRYTGTKNSLQMDPLYFEWDKFVPTLEKHFPDILGDILNHDYQGYALVQGQGQSFPANNDEFNISLRHSHTDIGKTQKSTSSRFSQPRTRGIAQHHCSFYHNTPEIPYNHHNV